MILGILIGLATLGAVRFAYAVFDEIGPFPPDPYVLFGALGGIIGHFLS